MDLSTLVARAEITDVLHRYALAVDRAAWSDVRRCYHPDAHDDHGMYRGGVDGLIEFLQSVAAMLTSTTHHLSNLLVEVDGDVARTQASCLGWYTRTGRDGVERSIAQGVRYLDHFERRTGTWAIVDRVVVLDWEHVFGPGTPASPLDPGWQRGARGTADPSAGHLRSVLSSPDPT